jgi:hypothetical protein
LDETGLPKAWKMWVGVLPIGGLEVSWTNWETFSTGAKVAKNHDAGLADVALTDVKAYQTYEEGGYDEDIFVPILE